MSETNKRTDAGDELPERDAGTPHRFIGVKAVLVPAEQFDLVLFTKEASSIVYVNIYSPTKRKFGES